jgi:hypothetical protein
VVVEDEPVEAAVQSDLGAVRKSDDRGRLPGTSLT